MFGSIVNAMEEEYTFPYKLVTLHWYVPASESVVANMSIYDSVSAGRSIAFLYQVYENGDEPPAVTNRYALLPLTAAVVVD